MPQPYRRAVSTEGGLSVPVVVVEDQALSNGAAYDESYTYSESARVDIYVETHPAEVQMYDGSAWTSDNLVLPVGMNELPSTHEGVRVRNRDGSNNTATVSISRYTT